MTYDYDGGRARMKDLVARFSNGIDRYKSPAYDETSVRNEFIDKFFECFGWDVTNEAGVLDEFKDVEKEYSMIVEGSRTKRPDYAFKSGGAVQFFAEAKKPSENIKDNPKHASQLKRYAFNKKIPISLLTDFEELGVYYCHRRPDPAEDPQVGRIKYYKYDEYADKFDELWNLFSKDSVLRGSIDKYAKKGAYHAGTEPVNKVFLRDIQGWREVLAKEIAASNRQLGVDELNYCVQKVLDRVLFLRICEDRYMEPYESLKRAAARPGVYAALCGLFDEADAKYNSGLFNFAIDRLTKTIRIKDTVLRRIIEHLYPPLSPYDFSVLSVEILGQVYEEFLGQTIVLTDKNKIRVEDKPETKVAGGVFYTPEFVVDYIVKNTVGRLIHNKSPSQMERIRVIDPACGSGTFLVRAYSAFLERHLKYYSDRTTVDKHPKEIYRREDGTWFLTTEIRKRILLNSIYGLDVDSYAVEITKLSLLLKVLENESNEAVNKQMKLFKQKALPDLDKNILCGNTLIDYSIRRKLNDAKIKKIRPFDWSTGGFGHILDSGGFNAVIGNPPYVRVQRMDKKQRDYFAEKYSVPTGTYDIYSLFVEVGLGKILSKTGLMSFIMPHKFFTGGAGAGLRRYIGAKKAVREIIHFGTNQVFDGPTTYTCILSLSGRRNDEFDYKRFALGDNFRNLTDLDFDRVRHSEIGESDWNFHTKHASGIVDKIREQGHSFEEITHRLFKGSSTGNDAVFVLHQATQKGDVTSAYSKASNGPVEIEASILRPFVHGEDVRKYLPQKTSKVLLFPYDQNGGKWELIPHVTLGEKYPKAFAYLKSHKKALLDRKGDIKDSEFYRYSAARSLPFYPHPKIMIPDMLVSNRIGIDAEGTLYHNANIHGVAGVGVEFQKTP
ncbi:MAG: N-6 DNA methylase [Thaumarchaeota archaeon]|nr:N-6 DNA methylase [Nitrososphaerota archaeon]